MYYGLISYILQFIYITVSPYSTISLLLEYIFLMTGVFFYSNMFLLLIGNKTLVLKVMFLALARSRSRNGLVVVSNSLTLPLTSSKGEEVIG